jgi:predicted O-linked N-acetylglucosamine transferase (SPINDLY family)
MPYSGGTTTCDALWMGVPVVTVPGSRSVSRSATSVLSAVGLPEWIAPSAAEYVRRAVRFAGERDLLTELRGSLRERMLASPLMDEERFTRDLEQAYREMWRKWCEGDPA